MWDNMYKSMDLLQKGLSASWTRNAVIRNNIANVETPNFKASDVEFESLMERALMEDCCHSRLLSTHEWHIDKKGFKSATTHDKHIEFGNGFCKRYEDVSSVTAQVNLREDTSMRMDGNNVDIEDENVKLAQNSLYYNTLLEKMNSEIRRLRMAINEGRG